MGRSAGSKAMFRKILIGMAAVAIACAIAGAGYKTGQYLAQKERAAQAQRA